MGSLEEEKLAEMVRDFIESESTPLISQSPIHLCQNPTFLSLQEIMGKVMDCEREVHEKILRYLREMEKEEEKIKEICIGNSKNVKKMMMKSKWVVLRLKMDKYEASICKSSWVSAFGPPFANFSTFGTPSGDYEYMDVMIEEDSKMRTRLIIDMDFRSQFELVRPTESYTELKNLLPSIFVGSESKLNSIINLMCSAAKDSLKQRGLHIPPWRKVGYMKSKWLSHNCKKLSFSSLV